jgi:Cu-Zn family superoxide dismutase
MTKILKLALLMAGASVAGCVTADGTNDPARAEIRDSGGRIVARAAAAAVREGVRVRVETAGLAAGSYGAHVHAVGRCEAPGFDSAGPHWNPTTREHGSLNPRGHHLGDLPNLVVGVDGAGSIEFTIPTARMSGGEPAMMDGDGAAIVIHARPDDYRTDPSGNSGARIACGILS